MVLLAVGLLAAVPACAPQRPPDVVLITLDTVRADMFGSYGGRGETPRLDALAAEAARYEDAITTAPYTGPSHASLLTGLYPPQHGLRDFLEQALPEDRRTLAEILSEHGYATAAFVSTYVLDPRYGLDQGFERYSMPEPAPGSGKTRRLLRRSRETFDEAIAWLRARDASEPLFLWLHSYDAHAHLSPRGPFYLPPPDLRRPLPEGVVPFSDAAQRQRYYEQAGDLDREVDRVLGVLRELGRYERAVLIVTADHGELLGRHGRKLGTHSPALVDETLRVPLLVRVPGRLAPGRRAQQVSLVDLLPTVLDALELPAPEGLPGRSLLDGDDAPRAAYSETLYEHHPRRAGPGEELASLRYDGWKLVVRPGREELYDLRSDPDELHDLADRRPEQLARLRSRMQALRTRWSDDEGGAPLELPPEEREAHVEQLRALGYVE